MSFAFAREAKKQLRKLRYLGQIRWLVMSVLTAFVVVQLWPYTALAHDPPISTARQTLVDDAENPLVQLHNLPDQAVSLSNFALNEDTFQFSNSELIGAIDRQRDAAAWEEVLTEQLEQLFGTQVCIGSEVQTCVLTAAAKDWLQTQLERIDLGIGEGMAAAVLALWQADPPQSIPWWQQLLNFLLGRAVFGLARSLFELQTYIANLFLMQGVTEVFQATQDIRENFTPTQILLTVVDIFLTGSPDPFTMGIYRVVEGLLTEGHTLTPYRVEAKGEGKYWMYVYDSNFPVKRSTTPSDLYVEFDTVNDTWSYQTTSESNVFEGDASSKNIDLTQLSWRQVEKDENPAYKGPFTCPFCRTEESVTPADLTIDITLIGEGLLTVESDNTESATEADGTTASKEVARIPFKGGLDREVPASYRLPDTALNQPLKVILEGTTLTPTPATLQLTGPGYTADFANIALTADEAVTLYIVPNTSGPELTLVASQGVTVPTISIYLTDDTNSYEFDSSTTDYFSLTERQVSKSSGFKVEALKLAAGKRVAMALKGETKRLYFADDDDAESDYDLTVENRIVIRDRVQIGERQPDFANYTLSYEEDMTVNDITVGAREQAYFDYDPTFIDPSDKPRDDLLEGFDQRNLPVAIAYESLALPTDATGPLRLTTDTTAPIDERIFQGSLSKAIPK